MNHGKETPSSARKRYLKYSLYAWGCPLLIFIVTVIMQTVDIDETSFILPRIGETDCFIPLHGLISF